MKQIMTNEKRQMIDIAVAQLYALREQQEYDVLVATLHKIDARLQDELGYTSADNPNKEGRWGK